jgi:hypothetical protein
MDIVGVDNLTGLHNLQLSHFATIGMTIQSNDARTGAGEFRKRALEEVDQLAQLRETLRRR